MKVSEAKEKVCPFMQSSAILNGVVVNDEIPVPLTSNINCICGDCMAFVFTDEQKLEGYCARVGQ